MKYLNLIILLLLSSSCFAQEIEKDHKEPVSLNDLPKIEYSFEIDKNSGLISFDFSNFKNIQIKTFLWFISKKTGVNIICPRDLIGEIEIPLVVNDISLNKLVSLYLYEFGRQYEYRDNIVFIYPAHVNENNLYDYSIFRIYESDLRFRPIKGEEYPNISFDFVADIKQILDRFTERTGLKFIYNPSLESNITIKAKDIPWNLAIVIILNMANCSYVLTQDGIEIIQAANQSINPTCYFGPDFDYSQVNNGSD